MKQKNKGFTLIELLAVIVILAIIALIAVPVVLNLINKARQSAFNRSAEGVLKASKLYYANSLLNPNGAEKTIFACDGVECRTQDSSGNDIKLNVSGNVGKGEIIIDENGNISFLLTNGTYYAVKYEHKEEIIVKSGDGSDVTLINDTTPPNININSIVTSKSIKVVILATEDVSGISGYRCGIEENGKTKWQTEEPQSNKICTYDNLENETEYKITVEAYNTTYGKDNYTAATGMSSKTEIFKTENIEAPIVIVEPSESIWRTSKTVSVNEEQFNSYKEKNYKLEYNLEDGEETSWLEYTEPIKFINNGNIIVRLSDGYNVVSSPNVETITMVDSSAPTESTFTYVRGSNSIQVVANGTDLESGIVKYAFSKDDGATWESIQDDEIYTFENLNSGKYNIKVRVYNGTYTAEGEVNNEGVSNYLDSETIIIETTPIENPEIVVEPSGENWSSYKLVTINYDDLYKNEYKVIDGEAYKVHDTYTTANGLSLSGEGTSDKIITATNGGLQYGPYTPLDAGTYIIEVNGTNLINSKFRPYQYDPGVELSFNTISKTETKSYYEIIIPDSLPRVELLNYSPSNGIITISSIVVYEKIENDKLISIDDTNNKILFMTEGCFVTTINDNTNTKTYTQIVNYIDTTKPNSVTINKQSGENSITLDVNAIDNESGISHYQFSIDNGTTWYPAIPQTNSTYTFSNLDMGEYNVKVRVYNGTYSLNGANNLNMLESETEIIKVIGSIEYSYDSNIEYYTFVAPADGYYEIEAWGARGGNMSGEGFDYENNSRGQLTYYGGKGAYTRGIIQLTKGQSLYVYVGGKGTDNVSLSTGEGDVGGYNGGGSLTTGQSAYGSSGGGATDIRLVNGTWNDFDSLKSRIMVAAGGGGANFRNQGYGEGNGGAGGTLIGVSGEEALTEGSYHRPDYPTGYFIGTGGNQTSGGYEINYKLDGSIENTEYGKGSFGGNFNLGQTGGGSGYYAGSYSSHGGAGGGSSFISGYSGCDAIAQSSTSDNIIHTGQSIHYSGEVFMNSVMLPGNAEVPKYNGDGNMVGNDGHGHAKITYLPNEQLTGYTVTNMIENGSFEDGTSKWSGLIDAEISDKASLIGKYSMALKVQTLYNHNMSSQYLSQSAPTLNHKYYGKINYYAETNSPLNCRYEWYNGDAIGVNLLPFAFITTTISNHWIPMSNIRTISSKDYLNNQWQVRNFTYNSTNDIYTDNLIIIDLTETFGEGNEPSKEWCDKNISYFNGTITIYK